MKRALSRKFIVPSNPREQAIGVLFLGAAMLGAGLWSPTGEAIARIGASSTPGTLIEPVPYRGRIEQRLVGVYVWRDERGAMRAVRSTRVRLTR